MGSTLGIGQLASQIDLAQAREQRFIQQANSPSNANDSSKIDKSARDFEAILVGSWLQQAEQTFATVPGSTDDDDSAGREQMMNLGVQSLATSMAAHGGIGIARMVAKALHATEEKGNAAATAVIPPAENPETGGNLRK